MDQVLDRPPVRAAAGVKPRQHALEPLDAKELRDVVAIVKRDPDFASGIFFETIELLEPSPEALEGERRPARRVPTCSATRRTGCGA